MCLYPSIHPHPKFLQGNQVEFPPEYPQHNCEVLEKAARYGILTGCICYTNFVEKELQINCNSSCTYIAFPY